MNPLVTIVTVTYNSAVYVRDAIESVLAQEYGNFEYIIADDCSTDDTWSIISDYDDSRILAYRNEINLGEYPNRNRAINIARGKYLLFIDGDDILLKHGLGYFVQMAEKFPEAAMVIQKGYFKNIVFPALIYSRDVIINHYFGNNDLLSSSFASNLFRLDVLKEVGMLSTQYKGGDNHIRVKIASRYPVLFIAGWASWPRETPGSASSKLNVALSIVEMYRYTQEMAKSFSSIDHRLSASIDQQMKVRVSRFMLNRLIRFKFKEYFLMKHIGGRLRFTKVIKLTSSDNAHKDIFLDFTPINPYRKDYLR